MSVRGPCRGSGRPSEESVSVIGELLSLLRHEDAHLRVEGLVRLARTYFGRCVPLPEELGAALVATVRSDPSQDVRVAALTEISQGFLWRGDSPIGPINVDLLYAIRSALPDALVGAPREDLVRVVGGLMGKLASLQELERIPEAIRESRTFKLAMVDGLTQRELDSESEALLQRLLVDPDPELQQGATELLDDT